MNVLDQLRRKPNAVIDVHSHLGVELSHYLTHAYPYGLSLEQLCADGDRLGVDAFVTFPMVTSLYYSLPAMKRGRIVAAPNAVCRFPFEHENQRMLHEIYELFPALSHRAIPFVIVDPERETRAQLRHIRQLRKRYAFYGIKIQTTMIQADIRELAKAGRCFLDFARDENLPFLIHSSVLPSDIWAQAHDILDIAEANPEIRFIAAHTCRFDKTALDRLAGLPNAWFDHSAFGIHCDLAAQNSPVCALGRKRFPGNYRKPAEIIRAVAEAYPDKFIFGSDAPYYSYIAWYHPPKRKPEFLDLRSSMEKEVGLLKSLPAALRRKVSRDNTLRFLTGRME
jgi:predicted TIM-barrel fold metal-dependent hydrolase